MSRFICFYLLSPELFHIFKLVLFFSDFFFFFYSFRQASSISVQITVRRILKQKCKMIDTPPQTPVHHLAIALRKG